LSCVLVYLSRETFYFISIRFLKRPVGIGEGQSFRDIWLRRGAVSIITPTRSVGRRLYYSSLTTDLHQVRSVGLRLRPSQTQRLLGTFAIDRLTVVAKVSRRNTDMNGTPDCGLSDNRSVLYVMPSSPQNEDHSTGINVRRFVFCVSSFLFFVQLINSLSEELSFILDYPLCKLINMNKNVVYVFSVNYSI
jgi:hypothetical protein